MLKTLELIIIFKCAFKALRLYRIRRNPKSFQQQTELRSVRKSTTQNFLR